MTNDPSVRTLLIVHHSLTGGARQMAEAAAAGAAFEAGEAAPAGAPDEAGAGRLEVRLREAQAAGPQDVLDADGLLFATPENLGAMSGLLKDFFDRSYYAALDQVTGRPYGVLVCAGTDGSNAARQIERIVTGWRLRPVAPPLIVRTGAQTPGAILRPKTIAETDLARCRELGGALAAGLLLGVF